MLKQSFTADNFRKIFDYENRKGVYLEGEFFPEIEEITRKIKKSTSEIKEIKRKIGTLPYEDYKIQLSKLDEIKKDLKEKKEKSLTACLEKISNDISAGNFQIKLKEVDTPGGKKGFTIGQNPHAYFAIKQVQYNIRKLYKVKQSSRYEIICQLKNILSDTFPKFIIRTDIKNFYESIPTLKLLNKINADPLLTLPSKKIIWQILKDHKTLSGKSDGLPRGIGISAYLSELYMRELDKAIRACPEVIFYSRYVDDIVVVFTEKQNSQIKDMLDFIKSEVGKLGLIINDNKTEMFDLLQPKDFNLDYLGYRFNFGTTGVELSLSQKKIKKYEKRIYKTFKDYHLLSKTNEKKARKLLVKRIRFLTGNTRLLNNKKKVLVGIYFSNSLLSDHACLSALDGLMDKEINNLNSEKLKSRLKTMSFHQGFSQRRFAKFSVADLSRIVGDWKYET